MTTTESSRVRGVTVFQMPESVTGGFDCYALMMRRTPEGTIEAMMVHTEGVCYQVSADKPWKWNDFLDTTPTFTLADLITILGSKDDTPAIDLADWVRTFGGRLEGNFYAAWQWATRFQSEA